MVLGPALFFSILEIGLRVGGIGHPTSFFLPMKIEGKDCLIENERFGWRFFGPEMARAPFPVVMPKIKPPDTTRIFVFGESAAYGDPQPEFGLSRMLEALLERRYPDRHFEVVNTAMTAINSHVILPIARECAAQHGDFWVIYMGNNEVVGPYGSGTVFGTRAPGLRAVRASIAVKRTYVGQLLEKWLRHSQARPVNESEWGGMVMFSRNHVRADDPRMSTVYHSFERNLSDIIDKGVGAHATVIVSTVVRNLKDCGPFASDHRPGLSADELPQWERFYQAGLADQQAGRMDAAIASFQQADRLDDTFAESRFRLAQCLLDSGRDADAAREFISACDLDTLRFRADSRINDIIRRVAAERQQRGVRLIDGESEVNYRSSHGIAGDEFLYEHVHLNFRGNYLVARRIAEQIESALPQAGKNPWPTEEDCARRLAWNDSAHRAAEMDIFARLGDAPFTGQADSQRHYQRELQKIEQLQAAVLPGSLQADIAQTKAAAEEHPDDWVLLRNLAHLQEQAGDFAGGVESLRRVTRFLPYNADAWQELGLGLGAAKSNEQAIAAFQTAIRLRPESVASLNSLAEAHAAVGQTEKAVREFREVLRRKPYWSPAHFGLGKILEATGHLEEANREYAEALKTRILTPASVNKLGALCLAKGWYDRAAENFAESLRLAPADPMTHFNLGYCLARLGRPAEAKAQYQEAIRLKPDFAEAHFSLGLELGQAGDATAAAAEFSEAVRLKPEFVEGHLNLGIALVNQNLNQQALDQFQQALRLDPTNEIALRYVSALRARNPAAEKQ